MSTVTGTSTTSMAITASKLPYPSVLCQPVSSRADNALWSTHSTNHQRDATVSSSTSIQAHASTRVHSTVDTESSQVPFTPSSQGTVDNPLIPKRRRRTSPQELAVLEQFFADCPLPTQAQRAQLSSTVGMTGRALQVWFQNRRQKEKKEASHYHPGSSAASSTGSATDPDQDAADLENLPFAFSSSPLPSEQRSLHAVGTKPLAPAFNAPSNALYSGLPVNKENLAKLAPSSGSIAAQSSLPSPPTSAGPAPNSGHFQAPTYSLKYSYPSPAVNKIPVYETDLPKGAQANTRPAATSIIAAKKHVRKRPLGSHAPLARKPSLPHAFNFPDSPPHKRSERLSTERPPLRRAASATSVASATSTGAHGGGRSLSGSFLTQSMTGKGDANRARVWLDALGDAQPLASPVVSPVESSEGEKGLGGDKMSEGIASTACSTVPDVKVTAASASGSQRGFMTRDEVWQHMASDAPSSPVAPSTALTRRAMLFHTAASEASNALDSAAHRRQVARLQHQQSELYGSASASSAATLMSAALEGSRAGGEAACALSALERKRARLVGHGEELDCASFGRSATLVNGNASSKAAPVYSHAPPAPKRRKSANGTATAKKTGTNLNAGTTSTKGRTAAASKRTTKAKVPARGAFESETPRSYASSVVDDACSSSSLSSMGDLSFSSTSTSATVSTLVGTPVDGPSATYGSYFPGGKAHTRAASGIRDEKMDKSDEDDERECAELLLGLGGFF